MQRGAQQRNPRTKAIFSSFYKVTTVIDQIFASMLQIFSNFDLMIGSMGVKITWDFLGIAASIACAIHCALLPVIMSSLPVFGVNIIHNIYFEWGMIALAFLVGAYSLVHGYLKHHRNTFPFVLFFIGFTFLVLKQFFSQQEYLFLAFAVCLIVSAHLLNFKYCRHSKVCNSPHHVH